MDKLLASLAHLATHHPATQTRDFDALLTELTTVLNNYEPAYAYRVRMSWDANMGEHGWFDPGSQVSAETLATKGHRVQCRLAGDWMSFPLVTA